VQYNNVDISIAVAIPDGLITPIVRNADQKSIFDISNEIKSLVKKAKESSLKPIEFQGGGITISNLGMYGINNFSAIINPPQGSILAVGAGIEKPVVKNGQVSASTVMNITMACDHRVIDGAVAAIFLNTLKDYIEKPARLLI
jgi:pyruvate dehydrogenase E2 component (dihydrolipoamide acetyltransferase)